MTFKYACFISYRHAEGELLKTMADQFCSALFGELEGIVNIECIYRDKKRVKAGDFFDKALSRALQQSVCMIVVYTPSYFDENHPYCAREFKAMEALERKRLKHLPKHMTEHGLIIPVIFRGLKYLPQRIKQHRHYYNFEKFLLSGRRMNRHPRFAPLIKEIAEYIADCSRVLAQLETDIFKDEENFRFPSNDNVMPFLKKVILNNPPFPGHEEDL